MGNYYETKHDAFNLKFKEHEVFKDQLVVVDESDSAFIWLNKETGKVSFSGKYFHLYKEQRLVEALKRLVYAGDEFVSRTVEIVHDSDELAHFVKRFERAISFVEEIEQELKEVDTIKFFEVNSPYYALLKAKDREDALLEYNASVAGLEDIEEVKEVERDYAIFSFSSYRTDKVLSFSEFMEEFNNENRTILLIDLALL